MKNQEKNKKKAELKEQKRLNKAEKRKNHKIKAVAERSSKREEYQNSLEYKLFSIAKLQKNDKKWYKLDNAALLYPFTAYGESTSIFRMSVQLKQPVDPVCLQYALNDVYKRFPTMTGCIKNGLFWYYIDKPYYPLTVSEQKNLPCSPIQLDGKRSQLRVTYFHHEISVEFFHSATDGTGGIIFLNSLLKCYFERLGAKIADGTNCLDHRDIPSAEEIRDNFARIAVRKNPPPLPPVIKAMKIAGTTFPGGEFITRRGVCNASQLNAVAKSHGATVTELLGAVELLALAHLGKVLGSNFEKPLRILVPVNLRKIYNVNTLRNFSSYIFYTYDGTDDVDSQIASIKEQTANQMNDAYFRGMVSYNYNSGNNPVLKIVPLGIKKIAVNAVTHRMGEGVVNTGTLSNVGIVKAPEEFADLVLRYEFQLGQSKKEAMRFAAATYNDTCVICVSNKFAETDAETFFFRKLQSLGVDFAIESDVTEGILE